MQRKILLADDEVHIRQVLSIKLRNAGYGTFVAFDGEEALVIARREQPSLVITDFQMPFMSGLEMCTELAADPTTTNIPVILLTARGHSLGDAVQPPSNIRQILSKPFSPRAILQLVDELLGQLENGVDDVNTFNGESEAA